MPGRRLEQIGRVKAERTPERIVALHKDVVAALSEWATSNEHRSVALKAKNLLEALVKDEQDVIGMILSQLAVDPIKEAPGLVELGPKQSRGGAARLFLWRGSSSAFFVVAAIEKGSHGVKIDVARKRAKEIRDAFGRLPRNEAVRHLASPAGAYTFIHPMTEKS